MASRLAKSQTKPSVLLIEAGGDNKDETHLIPTERYAMMAKDPKLNWGYKSVPQAHLKSQQIDLSRGRGLGGGTAINFQCYVIGSDEDFNEWSRLVGDDTWAWANVRERFKRIENYHTEIPREYQKFVSPKTVGQ